MKAIFVILVLSASAIAQDAGNRVTVPFSDPARPKTIKGNLINSCFVIEGYEGKDLIVEARSEADENKRSHVPRGAEGMKRIDSSSLGLNIEEENNTVKIGGPAMHSGSVFLRVPREATLNLQCVNGSDMKVTGITGDLELNNTNASVTATNVSGSVLAHSLNGKVTVTLDRV